MSEYGEGDVERIASALFDQFEDQRMWTWDDPRQTWFLAEASTINPYRVAVRHLLDAGVIRP